MPKLQGFAKYFFIILAFIFLTLLTQIGGIVFLLVYLLPANRIPSFVGDKSLLFILLYFFFSFLITPAVAPIFGREEIVNSAKIRPASSFTTLCNRNYVTPEVNQLLRETERNLPPNSKLKINYLDANFPFFDGFPLLPHLSHNDGKKLDLSLVYEDAAGEISALQKSRTGYGIYEGPLPNELNQTEQCKNAGYWQYDYSKYLTFGEINKELTFSKNGTASLINALLQSQSIGKLFLEPHLVKRLNLSDSHIRFHGCGAVRHDDHIHIQLK